jgi:eukaryotic-like serine/threonine-protein kinase
MSTDPTRWELVQSLFHGAAALPPDQRQEMLDRECAQDPTLLAEVMELLQHDGTAAPLLDEGLEAISADLLDQPLPIGRSIGPYRIVGVVGEGGMGVVYLAERDDLRSRVAIKMLRDAWVSPTGRSRFEREQRMLARLNHPHIARLLDAATLPDGRPYFVIEHVDGVPITDYCAGRGSSVVERLSLFRSLCAAVEFAHRSAILHRDLKPSNVLVTAEGEVKLLDFGIAKQLADLDSETDLTRTGTRPMTPAYASPEQIRGEPVGVESDVYSLGVILYELLTGSPPLARPGMAPGEVEAAILAEEPEKPSVAARRLGGTNRPTTTTSAAWRDLDVVCLTALQKDPGRRYRSVEALVRDLDNHRRGLPLEARPDSFRYRAGKFVRRNARQVIAGSAGAALLLLLSAGYASSLVTANRRIQTEAEKARQISDFLIGLFEAGDPFGLEPTTDVSALLARGEAQAAELEGQPSLQAELLEVLGRVRTNRSEYDRADTLLNRALALRRAGAPGSLELAATLRSVAVLRYNQGDNEGAEAVLREALALQDRLLPRLHDSRAETLDHLGVALTGQSRYSEANDAMFEALDIRRALFPEPAPALGETLNNLAVSLYFQGDLDRAERLYLEAIENDAVLFGREHPSLATNYANLARIYQDREQFDRAAELYERALGMRTAALGSDHAETAISHSQLAGLRDVMGDLEGARFHHLAALEIRRRVLGPDHPSVATSLNGLSLVQHQQGDYDSAAAGFRRVVEIYSSALGPRHRFTGVGLSNLAASLARAGRDAEAENAFQGGLDILAEVHPPDHPELAFNRYRYAEFLVGAGREADAEPLLRAAHGAMLASHGPEHQRTRAAAVLLERIGTGR